jgi:CRISPR-associated protein Cmr4
MQGELLFIHAITSLHPGCGTALGTVDIATYKGSATRSGQPSPLGPQRRDARQLPRAVGAGSECRSGHRYGVRGLPLPALTSTPVRFLSRNNAGFSPLPVRSLRGVFAWVTCPAALDRFNKTATRPWPAQQVALSVPAIKSSPVAWWAGPTCNGNKEVVLEEFCFNVDGTRPRWPAPSRP